MLPSIGAALAKFVSPLSTSGKSGVSGGGVQTAGGNISTQKHNTSLSSQEQKERKEQEERKEKKEPDSSPQQLHQDQEHPPDDDEPDAKPPPHLRLVQPPPAEGSAPSGLSPAGTPSVASSFLQIFNMLKNGGVLSRWVGAQSYENTQRSQASNGRSTKGAMLDNKIE